MANQRYEAFLQVAGTGSFKEAAQAMGYTQAGVSYLVNALEKELECQLFVRDYGGAHLTAEGEQILPWVQDVSNAERRLAARIGEVKHLEAGTVHVVTFTSTAIQWLPGIAKAFSAQHPGIELRITLDDDQEKLEEMLWRGDADCGFVVAPLTRKLHAIHLRQDPLLVALPTDHLLARAESFPLKNMAEEPYIRLKSGRFSEIDAYFARVGVTPHMRFNIDSDYAVMSMVSAGLGYSMLPGLIVRDAPFPLAVLPPEKTAERKVGIALRSLDTASAATRAFLDVTQSWVEQAYANGATGQDREADLIRPNAQNREGGS